MTDKEFVLSNYPTAKATNYGRKDCPGWHIETDSDFLTFLMQRSELDAWSHVAENIKEGISKEDFWTDKV